MLCQFSPGGGRAFGSCTGVLSTDCSPSVGTLRPFLTTAPLSAPDTSWGFCTDDMEALSQTPFGGN